MNKTAIGFTLKFILFAALFILCAVMRWNTADRLDARKASSDEISKRTVIVDAGHGGVDGGAVGVTGSVEKDINLSVALRMSDILKLCGVNCIMTREDDVILEREGIDGSVKGKDIKSRVAVANENPDALFVSVHMNSYPIEKYSGFQTFYSKNHPESRLLAESIQSSVRSCLQPDNDREIKAASSAIYLLHNAHSPAVLAECGFLSNIAEEELLRDTAYQSAVAATICAGIMNHLYN